MVTSKTALVYDEEMTRYKLLWVDPACKIEVPERLTAIYDALLSKGLIKRCYPRAVRQATDEEILLIHSQEYLEAVKQTPHMTLQDLMTFTQQYGDVYFHPNIFHCAKLAIGATLQLVDSVMTGEVRNGMALVRPPGHHSQRNAANGFCVFNNVAIAAMYAKKHYNVNRVLIVDWDIHHGQGIQYAFEDDPSVLYFSWHRYEHQRFWPNLRESDYDSVGKGKGAGYNINLPWNKVGMSNSDYLAAFCHVLLPVAYEFSPELILVSAGFDSAIGDPEGHMCATPEIFAHLTHLLMPLAGGKLCAVLEGGYHLTSLAQSVCQTVQSLLGDPCPLLSDITLACDSALESIQNARSAHRQYWACFKFSATSTVLEPSTKRCRTEEDTRSSGDNTAVDEEEKQVTEEEEEQSEEVVEAFWPEPLPRRAPPVRTVFTTVPPTGLEASLPEGCQPLDEELQGSSAAKEKLREDLRLGSENELMIAGQILSLLDQMGKKEICNALAAVPDVSLAVKVTLWHGLTLTDRVLVVFVGEDELSLDTDDKKVLLFQICGKRTDTKSSQYHVALCLNQGAGGSAGFMQAVLGLLLPLAYQFNPGLVVLAFNQDGGVEKAAWTHLTSLLQGLAHGQTLALLQSPSEALVKATAASLQGDPPPSLGPLGAPSPEDVDIIEMERKRLMSTWEMLRVSVDPCQSQKQHS